MNKNELTRYQKEVLSIAIAKSIRINVAHIDLIIRKAETGKLTSEEAIEKIKHLSKYLENCAWWLEHPDHLIESITSTENDTYQIIK